MPTAPAVTDLNLEKLVPGAVTPEARPGYSGYLVAPEKLVATATALRDQAGYTYLSSAAAVDYLAEGKLEMVYHLCRPSGGAPLALKAQTPRDNPRLPSLVPVFPGAEFQEREAWDLYGVRFENHPDLRRILLWEDFAGHPMRKDWHEAYFEGETKPFESRWPAGQAGLAEQNNPFDDNVHYPAGFTLEGWTPDNDRSLYALLEAHKKTAADTLHTDAIIVNLGPQHPSTHGVFRMAVLLDGETVVALKPVMGYLHRNHEKIGERNTFLQNIPFTDRLDYFCSMSNSHGYVMAVEKLMGVKPPERAEYLRVMMIEFTRIINHLLAIGFLLNDLGAYFTPVLYAFTERELILDIFEAVSGSRMMCNYFRFGGVVRDLPEGVLERARDLAFDRLPRKIAEFDAFLTQNEIIRARCIGVGVLSAAEAIAYSTAGPVLRASGVPYDLRRADPYSIYDRLDFQVAVRPNGDAYDRYLIRMDEMRESIKILQQVIRDLPGGEVLAGKPQYQPRVPAGEVYGRAENPKGELGYYVIATGKPNPYRYHIRAPSFINLTALAKMCVGHKIADAVTILGSVDIVLGEVDR